MTACKQLGMRLKTARVKQKTEDEEDYKKHLWKEQNKKENDIVLNEWSAVLHKHYPDDSSMRNKMTEAFTKYRKDSAAGSNWWDKSLEEKRAGLKEFESQFIAKNKLAAKTKEKPDAKEAAIQRYVKSHEDRGEKNVDRRKIAEGYIKAIEEKDVVTLRNIMNGINPEVNKLFMAITGLPARTQKEADASIRSLNPERWDAWQKQQAEKREQEKAESEAQQKQRELDDVLSTQVRTKSGAVITLREFYDVVIREGYTEVREKKMGVGMLYALTNPQTDAHYKIKKKVVAEYVKARIEEIKKETPKAATPKAKPAAQRFQIGDYVTPKAGSGIGPRVS